MNIRERILARPDLNDARAIRDITSLAAALNAEGAMAVQPRFVTARAVMSSCPEGIAILSALKAAASSSPAVEWALQFLGQEAGLDVGDPFTQIMIDQLVPDILTTEQAASLRALALKPVVVTQEQVALMMYHPDGTEK